MALGSVTIGGLASGLPADMVDQLMKVEERRLNLLKVDKSAYTKKKNALSELGTKLSALASNATTLQSESAWSPHTAASSNTDKLAVSASYKAVAGTHTVEVSRLASNQTVITAAGLTDSATALSAVGGFSFKYNGVVYDNTAVPVPNAGGNTAGFGIVATDTLADVATKINNYKYQEGEKGVSASVLYDGTNYRLVLTAKDQGAQVRNSDGTTGVARLEDVAMDLTWTGGVNWNTSASTGNTVAVRSVSNALTDSAATVTAGTAALSFDYGGTTYNNGGEFTIAGTDTLETIAGRINNLNVSGLKASVVNDGHQDRLVIDGATAVSNLSVNLEFVNGGGTGKNSILATDNAVAVGSSDYAMKNASATATAGNSITFTHGAVTYNSGVLAGTETLANIAAAINADVAMSATGLTASVINDGYQNRLVLQGTSAITALTSTLSFANGDGAGNTSSMTVSANSDAWGSFQTNLGFDAQMKVDGLSNVYSASNTVTEVLPGVTMTLKETTAVNTPVTVTVTDDTDTLKKTLDSFTTAYNDVIGYINDNKGKGGTLSGSTIARSIISQMRGELNTSTNRGDTSGDLLSPFSILAEMGLRTDQKTGKISFDSTELSTALSTNFNVLSDLFTNTQTEVGSANKAGLAYRLDSLLDDLTNSTTGALTGVKKSAESRITSIDKSIEREQARLDKVREMLTKRFSNLEQMVNSMNSQGSALTSAMSKLK